MSEAPIGLRCEFISQPLGIARHAPRLSWLLNDERAAELQTAYEIIAASSTAQLATGKGDLWGSGVVQSDQSNHIAYAGPALARGQTVWWAVRTFDSDGIASPFSEPAVFAAGLCDVTDWRGQWMASPLRGSRTANVQAVALRREFELPEPVVSAMVYVCVLGDYQLHLNGQAVDDAASHAMWSDFSQRAYYQSYEVTGLLVPGTNCLGALLTDGFYSGEVAHAGRALFGDRPQILVQLDAHLESGEIWSVCSDGLWLWRPSWVLSAQINAGEHVDARQYVPGWDEVGLSDSGWAQVDVLGAPSQTGPLQMISQPHDDLGTRDRLSPVRLPRVIRRGERHCHEFDFGEALVGRAQLWLHSLATDAVTITYALDADFSGATQDGYTTAAQAGGEQYTPTFAVHSFRYLRIEFSAQITSLDEVYAQRLTHMPVSSWQFKSDHVSLNRLFDALEDSFHSVAQVVPMAGLAPSERLPDLAYAMTWVPFFAQQTSARGLIEKWVSDLRCALPEMAGPGGESPEIAPGLAPVAYSIPRLPRAAVEIDEYALFVTYVRLLWSLYRHQGDSVILRDSYSELRVRSLSYKYQSEGLLHARAAGHIYGEAQGRELVATSCIVSTIKTVSQIASVLGHLEDCALLQQLSQDVRSAFRRRYISQDGHLLGDSQAAYVASLYHEMLEPNERVAAENRLIEQLQQSSYHVDLPPALLHALLPVLTQAGRLDVAYMVLTQTSPPSWLAAIEDHPGMIGRTPGEFDIANIGLWEWLVESLIGLRLHEDYGPECNAYRCVRICPMPPFGALFPAGSPVTSVAAGLDSALGRYEISWRIEEDCFVLDVRIPPGCTAIVAMPDGVERRTQSGHHRFSMAYAAGADGVPMLTDLAEQIDVRHAQF